MCVGNKGLSRRIGGALRLGKSRGKVEVDQLTQIEESGIV